VFSEDFSGFTTGTHASPSTYDLSATLDSKTSVPGWTGYKVYSAGGEIKLGTAEVPGWIETPEIIMAGYGGNLLLKFDISRWPDDAATVRVLVNGSQIGETLAPSNEFQSMAISLPEGISSGKVRFESSAKRFYLDNVKIAAQYPTGIKDAAREKVKVFPNPAADIIIIDNAILFDKLEVYNVSGMLLESVELPDKMSTEYSMSGYSQGLYFFRFLSQGAVFTVKVVKY